MVRASGDNPEDLFDRGDTTAHFDQASLPECEHPLSDRELPDIVGVASFDYEAFDFLADRQDFVNSEPPMIPGPSAGPTTM
jgi:hypothetical protein